MDWTSRIRGRFDPGDLPDLDVIEELAQHAASAYEAAVADGLDHADAVRDVEAQIAAWTADPVVRRRRGADGGRDAAADGAWLAGPGSAHASRWAGLAGDLRNAVRLLHRQPGYSAVAILTMALGIGAVTILFSVAYGVLLKPLPWAHGDRLVRLQETRGDGPGRFGPIITNAAYLSWSDRPSTIDGLGAWTVGPMTMGGTGDALRVRIGEVDPGLFPLLGARPLLGRLFTGTDATEQATSAGRSVSPAGDDARRPRDGKVVLSYGLWQERFGAAPDVLGRSIRLDGQPYTVIGVMPRSFSFPDRETRAWVPFAIPPIVVSRGGGSLSMFRAIARLRPGVAAEQASAEATARVRSAPDPGLVAVAVFGARGPIRVTATPLLAAETAQVRPAILVFLAAVSLLLLTATANVASVQLARAATRRREIAVQTALGAGGGRLFRQCLVESLVIGLSGGVAGLMLAVAVHRALPWLLPPGFPRLEDVTVDVRVMMFAAGLSLVTSIAFGLVPALQARRVNVTGCLAEDGMAPVGGGMRTRAARARSFIMAGQVAIACVLLLGAALLGRSVVALVNADRGYDPANVLTAKLAMPDGSFTPIRRAALLTALLDRVQRFPGVTRAGFTTALPLTQGDIAGSFLMRSPRTGATISAQSALRIVSPGYFAALGLRLVAGRVFTRADTATSRPVLVVNRAFALKYLSDRAVGDRIPRGAGDRVVEAEVVGVVDDVRHNSVTDPPAPELYTSYLQAPGGLEFDEPTIVVRTRQHPERLVPTLRALVREQDDQLAFDSVSTMEDRVSGSLAQPRLYATLLGGFAAFALAVAGVGLFGVLAYSVAQRSREIGVRAALGARPRHVVSLIVRQALGIVLAGVALGTIVAAAAVRWLSAFLYGVSAYDPVSFVTVPLVLLVVSVLACVVPARRAVAVDPVRALKG